MNSKFFLIVCFSFVIHISLLFIPFKKILAFNQPNNLKINYISIKKNSNKKTKQIFSSNFKPSDKLLEKKTDDIPNSMELKEETIIAEDNLLEFDMNLSNGPKIYDFKPEYPFILKKLQKEGSVKIKLLIDENGVLINKEIIYSTEDMFLKSVLKAIDKAKFMPAIIDGKPIKSYGVLNIIFKLED